MKNLVAIGILGLVASSCTRGVSRIETRRLPAPNPTSYSFPFPIEEVHHKAWQAFSIEHQVQQPIFGRSPVADHLENIFSAECATNAVFAEGLFHDPANAQDIYLHTFHMPFVLSPVYQGRHGGLPFIGSFHLHITSSGSNTLSVLPHPAQRL